MTTNDDRSDPPSAPVRRRGWKMWILLPAVLGASIGAGLAARETPIYKSATRILIVPQRLADSYVGSAVTTSTTDRLQGISQMIFSRTRLERIIQDFDLYKEERHRGENLEDIVQSMRKNIEVNIVRGDGFSVGFTGTEPRTVMKVAERLASLFIEENLKDRENVSEGTTQFLSAMLEDVRKRLVEKSRELQATKESRAAASEAEPLAIEYEVLQTTYKDLLANIEEARVAENIERRQIGEQFKVLDPARIPERPIAPDWRRHIGMGAGTGAAIGLLALLLGRATSFGKHHQRPNGEVPAADALPSEAQPS